MISGSWVRERRFSIPRLFPRRVRSFQTLLLLLAVAGIAWLGWTWYRGSSFVKVEHVTVTGLAGPDVPQIRGDLTAAALTMTTLNVSINQLETAVSQYGYVQSLTVTAKGSHALLIHVAERVPVATVQIGDQSQLVDADGQLLPSTTSHGALPNVPLSSVQDGQTIAAPGARAAISVLAAAPYALLAHVSNATSTPAHGVVVQLSHGPQIYFGQTAQLAQKWAAVVAVLQNSDSAGASYIDVTDAQRPAAGSAVSQQQASALGLPAGSSSTGAGGGATATGGSANGAATTTTAGTGNGAGTATTGG